jgi:branched-chain amino acid transport system substrate-binding protein
MPKTKSWPLWGALGALALPWTTFAEQPIRVGASMSLTGKAYSVQGSYGREGYLLCKKHTNSQGGVLGRPIEFLIRDDESNEKTASRLYEILITEDKVDAVLGPYGSAITDAVADVTEKHKMLMIAPNASTTSIWEKGRRYLIMMVSPAEGMSAGVLDFASRDRLHTLAVIHQDALVPNAVSKGAHDLARAKGLEVVFSETYPNGTTDFSAILGKAKTAKPDVLVVASIRLDDLVAVTHQMKELDFYVKMLSSLPYGLLPEYHQRLGPEAEFVYSGSFWEAGLPNPGNREFVAEYEKEFNRSPVVQSANAYAGCQILIEAIRLAGGTDTDKLRDVLLTLKTKTVLGDFAVDERGFQIGHRAITIQWQDGKQVVVWPDKLAAGNRRPTPLWSQR